MQLVDILRKHGLDYLGAHGGAVGTLKKQMAIAPITYVKQDRFQRISKHDTASTKERSPKPMLHDRWFDFNLSTVLKPYKFTEIQNRIIYIELPDVGRFDFVNLHFLGINFNIPKPNLKFSTKRRWPQLSHTTPTSLR